MIYVGMYELRHSLKGKTLVWVNRHKRPEEKGYWVEVGHEDDKDCMVHVQINRQLGMEVERDEKGFYRALVLKD